MTLLKMAALIGSEDGCFNDVAFGCACESARVGNFLWFLRTTSHTPPLFGRMAHQWLAYVFQNPCSVHVVLAD